MMLHWQILDVRARSEEGCYFVSRVHHPEGDFYIARYCIDPSREVVGSYSRSRVSGLGRSSDLEDVKLMCNEDAVLHCQQR